MEERTIAAGAGFAKPASKLECSGLHWQKAAIWVLLDLDID